MAGKRHVESKNGEPWPAERDVFLSVSFAFATASMPRIATIEPISRLRMRSMNTFIPQRADIQQPDRDRPRAAHYGVRHLTRPKQAISFPTQGGRRYP